MPSTSTSASAVSLRSLRRLARAPARPRVAVVRAEAGASATDAAPRRPKVVVVGGGWAGFGAAKHLSEQSYDVTLLDAAPDPGGVAAGWKTPSGREMEAGIKGFWKHYPAIEALLADLGVADCLTPYEVSGFWQKNAAREPARLINEAPVFGSRPRLPTPLGQALWTAPYFRTLSLADRASVLGVMAALIDARSSPGRFAEYDEMTAKELFSRIGATKAAYEAFLKPTLLVALFAPPEQLSAAETLAALEFYALRSQDAFDVRWCRGSIADRIFAPLVRRISASGGRVLGSHRVTGVTLDGEGKVDGVTATDAAGSPVRFQADAVVFAVGISGMQRIVSACPALASRPEFRAVAELRSIDCVSVRLWLDRAPATRFPCNVLAGPGFTGSASTGGTFFNLNAFQDGHEAGVGVLAADFYGSPQLLLEEDGALVSRVLANAAACEPGYRGAAVIDSAVARARSAVTHFSPGSLKNRPFQVTSLRNAFIAGDWVKGVDTRADGLSQERALVTGLAAAGLVVSELGVGSQPAIPAVPGDEPHMAAAKAVAGRVREVVEGVGLRSPFLP